MSARSALFWSGIDRFFQQGVQFVISIILARLIAPEGFGLIAMVVVFIGISKQVMEGGMRAAIIQRKDLNDSDCTTALTLNLLLGATLTGLIWLCAPYIATFYREPALESVARVLAFGMLLQAPSVVQIALFSKSLDFKKQTYAAVISGLFSGAIGIYMAYAGYGVWALVTSTLTGTSLLTLSLWFFSNWRPKSAPSVDSFKRLFPYGSRIAVCSILETVFNNIFPLLIGRFYAAADVAYFQRAYSLKEIPINNLHLTVHRVLFPLLCAKLGDSEAYLSALKRVFHLMAFLVIPGMALLFLIAEPLIVFLVGAPWLPAAPILQMLCVVGVLNQFVRMNDIVLTTNGLAGLALKLELLKRGLLLVVVLFTVSHGVLAMVLGLALQCVVSWVISSIAVNRIINFGFFKQLVEIGLYGILGISLAYGCHTFLDLSTWSAFAQVVTISLVFGSCYGSLVFVLRLSGLRECLGLVLPKFRTIL